MAAATVDIADILNGTDLAAPPKLVSKADDLQYDLGNLTGFDLGSLDKDQYIRNSEAYIKDLGRENAQLLFTQIWNLPTSAANFGVLAQLPAPTHPIPREKPVPPSEKPLTKWEEYAKIKGIKGRKKDRMEFDERLGLNRPRWGFKSKTEDMEWAMEANPDDPEEDPWTAKNEVKKEKLRKQQRSEGSNKARAQRARGLPGHAVALDANPKTGKKEKDSLAKAFEIVRKSTASLGRFDKQTDGEKKRKPGQGQRKKFSSVTTPSKQEQEKNLALVDKIFRKEEGSVNASKAANQEIASQNEKKRLNKANNPPKRRKKR